MPKNLSAVRAFEGNFPSNICPLGRHYIRRERQTGNRAEMSAYFPGPRRPVPRPSTPPGDSPRPRPRRCMTGFFFDKQGIGIFLRRISRPVKFRRIMSFIEYGVTPILLHSQVSWTQYNGMWLSTSHQQLACLCAYLCFKRKWCAFLSSPVSFCVLSKLQNHGS